MRSTALEQERETATRLMDLLAKRAQEPDAYDRVLVRTPVNIHVGVRERRANTRLPIDEAETGTRDQEESPSD
jgi:hypothetical protein